MTRQYFINGETLVTVKGAAGSTIPSVVQLGLASEPIQIEVKHNHLDINVDAFSGERGNPPEVLAMGGEAMVRMTLVHYDPAIVDSCLLESLGGVPAVGQLPTAGTRMLTGKVDHTLILNILSPVGNKPWRFPFAYLAQQPVSIPLGVERSLLVLTWRCLGMAPDPWGNGVGSLGATIWDYTIQN